MLKVTYRSRITHQISRNGAPMFRSEAVGQWVSNTGFFESQGEVDTNFASWNCVTPYEYEIEAIERVSERDVPLGTFIHCRAGGYRLGDKERVA